METLRFETGNIYQMRFITDSDLLVNYICTKRTDKTVSFERYMNATEVITKKIKVYNNEEYIVTGSYSMAPSIKSSNLVG
jgi:hypothetical protein